MIIKRIAAGIRDQDWLLVLVSNALHKVADNHQSALQMSGEKRQRSIPS